MSFPSIAYKSYLILLRVQTTLVPTYLSIIPNFSPITSTSTSTTLKSHFITYYQSVVWLVSHATTYVMLTLLFPPFYRNAWMPYSRLPLGRAAPSSSATKEMKRSRSMPPTSWRSPRLLTASRVFSQSFPSSCCLTTLLCSEAATLTVRETWPSLSPWSERSPCTNLSSSSPHQDKLFFYCLFPITLPALCLSSSTFCFFCSPDVTPHSHALELHLFLSVYAASSVPSFPCDPLTYSLKLLPQPVFSLQPSLSCARASHTSPSFSHSLLLDKSLGPSQLMGDWGHEEKLFEKEFGLMPKVRPIY